MSARTERALARLNAEVMRQEHLQRTGQEIEQTRFAGAFQNYLNEICAQISDAVNPMNDGTAAFVVEILRRSADTLEASCADTMQRNEMSEDLLKNVSIMGVKYAHGHNAKD